MEKMYKEGKCKAIGVSNFTIRHLEELLQVADVVPAVNQVEFHPWLYQKDLLDYCNTKGIKLEAYSPLTKGKSSMMNVLSAYPRNIKRLQHRSW